MLLVGISVGLLNGLFSGTPVMVENGPSKKGLLRGLISTGKVQKHQKTGPN